MIGRGQLSYLTKVNGQLTRGFYPFVASMMNGWEVQSMEFLDPSHPLYALRPASPLFIAGPKWRDGRLIFVLDLKKVETNLRP